MFMLKQEITLKGLDGHEDHLVYDAANGKVGDSLEECARSLFPQEGETTPRLRFQGFEGEWEKAKASDLFVTFNERNRPDLPVLSACQDIRGMAIRSESGYDISHDRSNEVTYKVVKPGQFVIHLRSFQGGFAHSAVEGITSPAYTVFGFKNPERHDDYFWKIIFMSKAFIKRLETITYGIRDGRSISFEEFSNMNFLFPSYEEQKTIASFFRRLDSQIALRKNQFERLQQVKSACLESMFPRETEIAPPIRFKGFDGEWVVTKLNEISKKVITKNSKLEYKVTLTNSAEHGIINQLDFFDHDISNGDNIRGYYVVEDDDFVYNPRISTSAPVGPINRNQLGYAGVMSPLYYVFRVDGIDKDYLSYFFKTSRWHQFMYDNGNTGARFDRLSISDDVFGQMPITHPKEMAEQKCIATFFKGLDSHITAEQQRLERLKQMKSACLRSMFPQNGGG